MKPQNQRETERKWGNYKIFTCWLSLHWNWSWLCNEWIIEGAQYTQHNTYNTHYCLRKSDPVSLCFLVSWAPLTLWRCLLFSGMGCNECTHPSCQHSLNSLGIGQCVECDSGVLVLDPTSGPKWRMACNKCNVVVHFFEHAHKVQVRKLLSYFIIVYYGLACIDVFKLTTLYTTVTFNLSHIFIQHFILCTYTLYCRCILT